MLEDETVDGAAVFHIRGTRTKETGVPSTPNPEEVPDIRQVTTMEYDLFIGKSDYLLMRMAVVMDLTVYFYTPSDSGDKQAEVEETHIAQQITYDFYDYDEPVHIEIPESIVTPTLAPGTGFVPHTIRVEPASGPAGTTVTVFGQAQARGKLRIMMTNAINFVEFEPHTFLAEAQVGLGDLVGDWSATATIPEKLDEMGTVDVGPGEYSIYLQMRTEDRPLGSRLGTAIFTVTDGGSATPQPTPTLPSLEDLPISTIFPSVSEAQELVPFEIKRPNLNRVGLETVWISALVDWSKARIVQVYKVGEGRLIFVQAKTDRPWSLVPGDRELITDSGIQVQLTIREVYTSAKWVMDDMHFEILMEKGLLSDDEVAALVP